ncbi:MAG: hypothetical protein MUF00_08335, partial [Gemmatimonadaceae bacterium]|nr:hypothetical protein [Gemmatimonadaceae bacterium]
RAAIAEPRQIAPSAIADGLMSLKDYVCDRFDRSETSRNRAILTGMRDLFGGLTAAALNGGLLAASVGITGAASAVSVAAGSAIAADGYTAVRRLF